MSNIQKIKSFTDERGNLLPIEFNQLEFEPKRVFIVNDVPVGDVRGNHAHHKTKQFLICTKGEVKVMLDYSTVKETYHLYQNESIMIPELVWDSQQFLTEDSEIMVICSTEYDINDYILTYDKYINVMKDE
jgi:UDP-2-acetamido-3-amino-2,3-dideoxy-glucuronate N-acetyltransferase